MISDLTTTNGDAIVPRETSAGDGSAMVVAALDRLTGSVQPVRDVQVYLATRKPQPEIGGEESLLITLPAKLQAETKALVRACVCTRDLVSPSRTGNRGLSVQAACKQTLAIFDRWCWKLATFRQKFDLWNLKRDWIVLVNLAKAPAAWKAGSAGLPGEFLAYCEQKFGRFGREDGKRQALLSIHRHWRTGRNEDGCEAHIPGYEAGWKERNTDTVPGGWSYSNITRQIAKRARFTKATRAMLHDSESAARQFLPQVLQTRANLRFLEKVTFDDVRMDWLVFNPATGAAEELWLLIARDEATAMVLGFVMHPATVREDPVTGTSKASHLGARQMKELAAYLLERFPLPPYLVHWIVERGTATLAEGVKAALAELFNDRIRVHYTSMIGGASPTGYAEKRKGNSRGKASHEAHNRLFHTQASFIAGQTGSNWGIRPADLEARIKECRAIHEFSQQLPEDKRADVKYPLLTLAQARKAFEQICHEQNCRREHVLEGFEKILVEEGGRTVQRMEMPAERALRLINAVDKWERCSPEIIRSFLEHTQRQVTVEANGEIKFMHEGKVLTFCNAGSPLAPNTKALAYHHPADPQFLHLTSGDGRILGTWSLRGRGNFLDGQAIAEAMRYTHAARATAQSIASELAAPQREQLDAMRASNAALEQFVVTTDAPATDVALGSSVVGRVFTKTRDQVKAKIKADETFIRTEGAAAAEEIFTSPTKAEPVTDAGDDFLNAISRNK